MSQASFERATQLLTAGRSLEAERVARAAALAAPAGWRTQFALAALLIDIGAARSKARLIDEGITICQSLLPIVPARVLPGLHFNLGNGYLARADMQRGRSLAAGNAQALAAAVNLLAQAVSARANLPESRINLAAALLSQGRAIEAIDLLSDAIAESPKHPMGYYKRARALEHVHAWMHPRGGLLETALVDARAANERCVSYPEYAPFCAQTVARLSHRVKNPPGHEGEAQPHTEQTRWLWDQRLALNPCNVCRDHSPTAFDVLVLEGLLHSSRRRPSADEVAEIVSAWHRTYSSARWVLLQASVNSPALPKDHVVTLPGAAPSATDLRTGLRMLAVVGFHSLFDQLAFGLNAYLHLGHTPERVNFNNLWYRPGKRAAAPGVLNPTELHPAVRNKPLPPLSALYWLARSLQDGDGLYRRLRELRNRAEHHVALATKTGHGSTRLSAINASELEKDALALGRLAKAALWYAGGTIFAHERRRANRTQQRGASVTHGSRWVRRR